MNDHSLLPVFVNVILPVPIPRLFTYQVPIELQEEVAPGKRVIVQFGAKRFYSAIIHQVHSSAPEGYQTKEIISILDDLPAVNAIQLKFWDWISTYYMCTLGDVMKAALPSGLKLESETKVYYNPEFEAQGQISESEELILNLVSDRHILSIEEISKTYKKKDVLKIIKKLVDDGALILEESLKDRFKVKTETFVELMPHLYDETELKQVFDVLGKAPKQLEVLMSYIQLSGILTPQTKEISKKDLLAHFPSGGELLKTLIKKHIFQLYEKKKHIGFSDNNEELQLKLLSQSQQEALNQVKISFEKHQVVLLHGYTASGKTELYIQLIDEQIKAGKQVLYLLPEIALTTQIINRLKGAFGEKAGVYHSKFSDSDRVKVWESLHDPDKKNQYQIILGVRSSIFLPFSNLGLIIIDEEHENSYKQFDPAPRYHARDSAIVLAQLHGAKTLLGTATPSVESYFNAENEKYGLVQLFQRYSHVALPETVVVNTQEARVRKQMKSHFHPVLIETMQGALDRGEQIILFQNRRGYSPYFQCSVCNSIPKCKHCDVSLTYHKNLGLLTCHYCGYSTSKIVVCEACGSSSLVMHGFGTEKIEDELSLFFPGKRIARMDFDTTRSRKAYEEMIHDFENRELDILVGTQMITKGLDFDHVHLVGILDADHLLNFPDFRAFERSFQLMSQVSGRAGRKEKQGRVIIQTTDPKNYIIQDVINNDFLHMYRTQLEERKSYGYPPFARLIQLTLKHKNQSLVDEASSYLAESLRLSFGNRVFGPEYPLIGKISNWYHKNIMLKIERHASFVKAKEIVRKSIDQLAGHETYHVVIVQTDIDPM
jgi:primosomal protein N' (replication factor Y) (superfamily II helicase)